MTIQEILKEQVELQRQHLQLLARRPELDITGELKKQALAAKAKQKTVGRFRLDG